MKYVSVVALAGMRLLAALTLFISVSLILAIPATASVEIEPNNSAAIANAIVPGEGMSGQVASESDQDWFGFSVTGPQTVTIHFDSPEDSAHSGYHTIQVRDGSGTIFAGVDVGQDTEFQTGLPSAGTYFIVVRDGPDPFDVVTQQ